MDELVKEGVPQLALERAIIMEFASARAAFDAFCPEGYLIGGEYKKIDELPSDYW